jgi:sugar diacid utilization regulator
VARVGTVVPAARAHAIAGQAPVALGDLSAHVRDLVRLCTLGARAGPATPVVLAARFALDRLLWDNVAPADARRFVEERLGALIAWDREHRTDLLRVLEAALDFPRLDHAASRCFMHRNTFRNRLKQATDLLGGDLEDPDLRLAIHVALKLRRGLPSPGARPEPVRRHVAGRASGRPERVGADHAG